MKRIILTTASAVLLGLLAGCTYSSAVRSSIAPATVTGKRFDGNVAMIIGPEISSAQVTSSVGYDTVKVDAGDALRGALVEAARVVFPRVAPLAATPSPETYDVLVRVSLSHIAANPSIEQGFWTARSSITAQVSVVIEVLRRDGSIAYRQVVTGTGLENRPVANSNAVRQGVELALERAIQQIADGAATAFISALSEIDR